MSAQYLVSLIATLTAPSQRSWAMRDQVASRNEERLQIESRKTQKSGREPPVIPKGLGLGSTLFLVKISEKWIANCSVAPSNLYTAFPMGGEDSQ